MTNPQQKLKVDLSLLKSLVAELEASVAKADGMGDNTPTDQYIAEMARASGLVMALSNESGLLVKDIYAVIRFASVPVGVQPTNTELEELEKVLGGALSGLVGGIVPPTPKGGRGSSN
jgi:hypothetical protein